MLANSFLDGEDTVDLRNVFAMFESVGEHSKSQRLRFRDRFILKGAMLYLVWSEDVYRPTRDLDLLGLGSAETDQLVACFCELCSAPSRACFP